jgi:hypothetical protein
VTEPLQEALVTDRLEAYPRYKLGRFKSTITLKMEAMYLSETSVPTRVTGRHIPGGGIPYSHGSENLKPHEV